MNNGQGLPLLRVSDNKRFLVYEDGKPFFYLADTAWELFHRLNREEAARYLQNRTDLQYTVIQAVALAELDGLNTPNALGDKPLLNNDPATPDTTPGNAPNDATQYDYWDHVDYIVSEAEKRGLYIALLPTWGDKWNKKWGQGPEIFTPENAATYGEWLGRRYRDRAIIWVLGGDRPVENDTHKAIIRALAAGLKKGDEGRHLMTFHPMGGQTSATWFHEDGWLDFNMQQNGHGANTDVWNRIPRDAKRAPFKPVLDGEPLYEDHPIGFDRQKNGTSNDWEIRKFAYWDVFSGALGHTYGNHSIWQMHDAHRGGGINGPISFWHQAIHRPGSTQMQYLRRLIESRPFLSRIPDQSLLASNPGEGADHVQATRDENGSYAFIYSASAKPVTIDLSKLSGETIKAYWYDPRSGKATFIGQFPREGKREFTPPSQGAGNDWVLVLDDAARKFLLPG